MGCPRPCLAYLQAMANTDRIDFISSYCDRWCERCAFTDRCSSFACDVAIGMCGDVAAGIELAVGVPEPVGAEQSPTAGERFLADYVEPSADELAETVRSEAIRNARLVTAPLAQMSMRFGLQAHAGWKNTATPSTPARTLWCARRSRSPVGIHP